METMRLARPGRTPRSPLAIRIVLAGICLMPLSASAQQPDAPQPALAEPLSQPPPSHAFWDRTNLLLFSEVGVLRGLDYASTRNFQARCRDEILLPDDVVNNFAGFAAVEAAATATSVGLSYWMHRTGHHSIERWVSIVHISVTGFGVARNYALKSKHMVPAAPGP